ncbi:PQQ-dependent oxidoreductase, gdhB family [Thioalkalivibrio nitratireducens DSM 14787]|uniref:PQQ-dependent oxidoreductase, gdhB family n=1 Tax=Thioalkalivibrio nitratireducens (strain DSM 14787 / UNIQEM 213 / ALEN2) TaxID=1255043 RepID=L0DZ54_THIND|nr:PQQ-dependent oxidoreductase, gdhB family [Thioalkalivibrio nitratireducens DSM 14787]
MGHHRHSGNPLISCCSGSSFVKNDSLVCLCRGLLLVLFVVSGGVQAVEYRIETVASGLEHPWAIAFLPDDRMLVTERAGRLRIIDEGRLLDAPVAGVPESFVRSQGGLLEVLPDPGFDDNGLIYLTQAHGTGAANTTRLLRARLDGERLADVEVLFEARPMRATPVHFGGRLALLPDGTLVLGLGDAFDDREDAQRLDSHTGSIVRVHRDGRVPADNPFVGRANALPEIYSYGHRNVQGIVFDAENGVLWAHEHGPRGGDELNLIEPGVNYGWPVASHGIDYSGARITPYTSLPGMRDPVRHWTPAIAPSGMTLYRGDQFPEWRGSLLISSLVQRQVRRLSLDGTRVIGEEVLFVEVGERLRDVREGPDGALYLLTDKPDGRVLRVTRADAGG